ncbi:cysteine/glutathione ABC transporter membrane /ATP-binding component [Morganella morganii]|nr:cysteine/glutathione ABC transporter membrane /ATP-binding component [Morganella morganii]
MPGIAFFNYMLPAAGVRGAAISRTAGRYAERLVSHSATFRVLKHLRVFAFEKILPLTPGGIARFRQGELLNRLGRGCGNAGSPLSAGDFADCCRAGGDCQC